MQASPWLKLLRPPNQFTVPGDVVAGFAIAGGFAAFSTTVAASLAALIGASLLLYSGGLLLNDWADRDVDLRERPDRPIPSGAVAASTVRNAALACLAAAIALAATAGPTSALTAAALATCVMIYNLGGKKVVWIGVPVMAGCRVLNILLGASIVSGLTAALPAAFACGVYLILICLVARDETERLPPRWLICMIPVTGLLVLVPGLTGFGLPGVRCIGVWLSAALMLIAFAGNTRQLLQAKKPSQIPPAIGSMIRALILIQAYWIAAAGAPCLVVVFVLALWPGARITGKWFYAS